MSTLYFSKDTRLLSFLPIRERDLVLSKILQLYIYLVPLYLLIYIPAVVVSALNLHVGVLFVISSIIQCVAGAFVPLGFSVIFVALLTKLVNMSRSKTAIEVIGMVFGVAAAAGAQFLIIRTAAVDIGGGGSAGITTGGVAGELSAFIAGLLGKVPPAAWSARAFLPGGIPALAGSVSISALFLGVALLTVAKGFLTDVSGRNETRRRKSSHPGEARIQKPRKPLLALLRREWVVLSANSTFIFEGMAEVLIFPILVAVFAIVLPKGLARTALRALESAGIAELAVFGVLVMLSAINSVAATSISREGRSYAISLTLPVSAGKQVLSKLVFQLCLFFPAYLASMIVLTSVFQMPAIAVLYIAPGGAAYIALMFFLGFFIDLRRPLLNWTHPQQAMKQNMNTLAAMGLGVLVVALSVGAALLLLKLGIAQRTIGFILTGTAVAAATAIGRGVFKYAEDSYVRRLEM
jgi:ABC-2 type transport system permease protein